MKHRVAVLASTMAAAFVCLPAGVVLAQNTDQTADQANGGGTANSNTTAQSGSTTGVGQLQEVVVTAERRAANVQTTPIAVTAVQGDQLQTLHLNTISDLQTTVPSFQSNDEAVHLRKL